MICNDVLPFSWVSSEHNWSFIAVFQAALASANLPTSAQLKPRWIELKQKRQRFPAKIGKLNTTTKKFLDKASMKWLSTLKSHWYFLKKHVKWCKLSKLVPHFSNLVLWWAKQQGPGLQEAFTGSRHGLFKTANRSEKVGTHHPVTGCFWVENPCKRRGQPGNMFQMILYKTVPLLGRMIFATTLRAYILQAECL